MSKVSVIVPVYNVEKYIHEMLTSVREQSFEDFEVIIINDGSSDNSQDIIDEFCRADNRFTCYTQENQGVSAARNNGLAKVAGEYIVFYDPDDFIPKESIGALYDRITEEDADMAVGVMRERRFGECRYNANTIHLGKKKTISPFDKELLWSFSVCNKMFRRQLIIDNGIKFHSLKHAEDALFLFECIFASKKIAGCRKCVYEYKFRPFWESKSATQILKLSYLQDVIHALDRIEANILKNIKTDTKSSESKKQEFLDEFYARYLDISLFVGYYRQLWMVEDGILETVGAKVAEIRGKLSEKRWNYIVNKNSDLQLEKLIFSEVAVTENSILTFVVPGRLTSKQVKLIMNNIYDQAMPFFKVAVPSEYKTILQKNNLDKHNVIYAEKFCKDDLDTEFVMFVDPEILFSKNSIPHHDECDDEEQGTGFHNITAKAVCKRKAERFYSNCGIYCNSEHNDKEKSI